MLVCTSGRAVRLSGPTLSSSKNLLPDSMKLKREENYTVWKEVIEDIAVVNGLRRFIYKKGKSI